MLLRYRPILKGRDGEMLAIAHLAAELAPTVTPIFEVPSTAAGPMKDTSQFTTKVLKSIPNDVLFGIDTGYLTNPAGGWLRPIRDIADDLAMRGMSILPVLRLSDSDAQLADARYAAEVHQRQAIVRLGSMAADPDDEEAEAQITRLHDHAGLTPDQCDLVIDLFEVQNERDVTRAEPVARKCVAWAIRRPWRSITVAAGAMPQSLTRLPTLRPTAVPRWDLLLWERLRDLDVCYGDYAVAHPEMTTGGRAPTPNIRYADDDAWWIYRWPKGRSQDAAMRELCRALVESPHWPADGRNFSWGDKEIALRASGDCGPGNAKQWRAWGTSHHLAHVADQLRRLS